MWNTNLLKHEGGYHTTLFRILSGFEWVRGEPQFLSDVRIHGE